jgi:hypothetical protein
LRDEDRCLSSAAAPNTAEQFPIADVQTMNVGFDAAMSRCGPSAQGRSRDSALDKRRPASCALLTFRGERRQCDYELTAKRASAIHAVGHEQHSVLQTELVVPLPA